MGYGKSLGYHFRLIYRYLHSNVVDLSSTSERSKSMSSKSSKFDLELEQNDLNINFPIIILENYFASDIPFSIISVDDKANSYYCTKHNYRYIVPEILLLREENKNWDLSCSSFDI